MQIYAWLKRRKSSWSFVDAGVPLVDVGIVRLQAIVRLGHALDMILSGQPVGAQEALTMGLAIRVVPEGESSDEAIGIAKQLITFPELVLTQINDDATTVHRRHPSSFQNAIFQESNAGSKVISQDTIAVATKFSNGSGRHGSFKGHSNL